MKPTTAADFDQAAQHLADASAPAAAPEPDQALLGPPAASDAAAAGSLDVPVDADAPVTRVPDWDSDKLSTNAQRLAFIADVESGMTARASAKAAGIPLRTAYRILARCDDEADDMKGAVRKLLQAKALQRLEDWELAAQVGASKKGNHAPARDWLLHAGVIDALQTDDHSVRVAIIIGTDDKPMKLVSPMRQSQASQSDTE